MPRPRSRLMPGQGSGARTGRVRGRRRSGPGASPRQRTPRACGRPPGGPRLCWDNCPKSCSRCYCIAHGLPPLSHWWVFGGENRRKASRCDAVHYLLYLPRALPVFRGIRNESRTCPFIVQRSLKTAGPFPKTPPRCSPRRKHRSARGGVPIRALFLTN